MKVLLAEDSKWECGIYVPILIELGCSVTIAEDGTEALDHLASQKFDTVITDNGMPWVSGFSLLQSMSKLTCPPPTLIHSGGNLTTNVAIEAAGSMFPFAHGQPKTYKKESVHRYFAAFLKNVGK